VRLSNGFDGRVAEDDCDGVVLSTDGRIAAFSTKATNLFESDDNGFTDVFTATRAAGGCAMDSLNSMGAPGNGASFGPSVALVGRFVAFASRASDLVPGDNNEQRDIFVRDRITRTTAIVSVNANGEQTDFGSINPTITPSGRYISFMSIARNLVGGDNNRRDDVFVKDSSTGDVYLASVASDGTQGDGQSGIGASPMSFDGRYVAFVSAATNLVANDTNRYYDVFVHDRHTGETVRASVDSGGGQGWHISSDSSLGGISADGRYVVFDTIAEMTQNDGNQAGDVFLRDLVENTTTLVSTGNGGQSSTGAGAASIAANGRYVVMQSHAKKWDQRNKEGILQIFVRDLKHNTTTLVSENDSGEIANDDCGDAQISANGRFIAFRSVATNLVEGDTHGYWQVYVRDFLGCDPFLRGDSNCDGAVDFGDIDPFVLALIDEGEYVLAHLSCDWQCNNDINGDGNVDFNDIDGFVECLINNGCP
jgi:hypothetical protein